MRAKRWTSDKRAAGEQICVACDGRGKVCPDCGKSYHPSRQFQKCPASSSASRRHQWESCKACQGSGLKKGLAL